MISDEVMPHDHIRLELGYKVWKDHVFDILQKATAKEQESIQRRF